MIGFMLLRSQPVELARYVGNLKIPEYEYLLLTSYIQPKINITVDITTDRM